MKRYIIIAIVLIVGLTACDVLDTKPMSQISPATYFKTETDLQLFSNTFYNNLLDKSPYDDQSDLYIQQNLSAEMIGGNRRTVPNSGGGWSWGDLRKMNTLLSYIHQCEDEDAIVKYTALTRFFRAYFYFDKIKLFGDVPWYDQELGSADEELYKPRDSRELVMSKMIEDIDFAIENLPSAVSIYRVNKWAALALKARFCLYEGTFRKYHQTNIEGNNYTYYLEQAANAAEELIKNSPYGLYSTGNPERDYMMLFAQENASRDEYILAIKFDYSLGILHNATAHTVVPTQGRPGVTKKMINSYLKKDGTAFTDEEGWQEKMFVDEVKDRDPRLAQSIRTLGYTRIGDSIVLAPNLTGSVTGYHPIKYVQNPKDGGGEVDRNERSTADLPVFRFGEVLLNYAEAKAELGTLTQNDLDISINKLRDRVGMPDLSMQAANANPDWYLSSEDYGYPNVSGSNKGVLLEIRRERAIELTREGFRFDDLVRWKAGYAIDQDIYGMYFAGPGAYDLTGDGVADVVLYAEGTPKPSAGAGVQVLEMGKEILLTGQNRGYVFYHRDIARTKFSEVRDYHYPIPINERSLNKNLTQNPGWSDGLDF